MRTKVLMWMAASAMLLTLSQPASADTGRTVVMPFEFYALGHGDIGGGFCLNEPTDPVPPEAAAFQSCAAAAPLAGEDHVGITVRDSAGQPVYFTVENGTGGSAGGCGTLQWGHLSEDGLLPMNGTGPALVFPWAGPGINNVLDPGGSACTGSVDTNMVHPGTTGTVTFVFHNHLISSNRRTVIGTFEFYALGLGDIGGACLNDPVSPVPPQTGAFQSCVAASPGPGEDYVGITVKDSRGQPVYFTVQQDDNPSFAWGCGTLQGGDISADGLYPINSVGPGGMPAPDIVVMPWAGPGINDVLEPGGRVCTGSVDPFLALPGRVGTVTFTFYDNAA
jgi:hypothetical protein